VRKIFAVLILFFPAFVFAVSDLFPYQAFLPLSGATFSISSTIGSGRCDEGSSSIRVVDVSVRAACNRGMCDDFHVAAYTNFHSSTSQGNYVSVSAPGCRLFDCVPPLVKNGGYCDYKFVNFSSVACDCTTDGWNQCFLRGLPSYPVSVSVEVECNYDPCERVNTSAATAFDSLVCDVPKGDPDLCSTTEAGALPLLENARQECMENGGEGAMFHGSVVYQNFGAAEGDYCAVGDCNDGCNHAYKTVIARTCCDNSGKEPKPKSSFGPCSPSGVSGPGVAYDDFLSPLPFSEWCSDIPAGSGDVCRTFDSSDSNSSDSGDGGSSSSNDDVGDSSDSGSSSDSGGSSGSGGSSDSNGGNSSGSDGGGSSDSDGGNSSGSDGGGSSDSDGGNSSGSDGGGSSGSDGGNSSGSDGGGSSGSAGGGYWCDHHPDDPICSNAGYDDWCDAHPDDAFCDWSRRCSQNPHDPLCVNPQPPPGGGGGGGGSSGSSSGSDSASVITCKDLSNCDWAKLEIQLQQFGVEKEVRDSLKSMIEWLKYKKREDSLVSLMRWNAETDDRRRMLDISETINGRIFSYYAEQKDISNQQLAALNKMDSVNGLYYASSISGLEGNKRAIDTLRNRLENAIGDGTDDIVGAIERLTGTLASKGFSANVTVEGTDMSGVESGISNANNLLGKLDSTLASGNSNILKYLDSLSAPCEGNGCGDYGSADSGAFSGLDTSGLSSARWDSLLSAPGSRGLSDSVSALSGRIRSATATPFVDNMACPVNELSIDACEYFGNSCRVSLCDDVFYIGNRHFFEWMGVFLEFVAWVLFLVRIA